MRRLRGPDAAPHRCRHGADNRVDSNPRTGDTRRAVDASASRMITRLRPAERAAATVAGVKCRVVRDLLVSLSSVQINSVHGEVFARGFP